MILSTGFPTVSAQEYDAHDLSARAADFPRKFACVVVEESEVGFVRR